MFSRSVIPVKEDCADIIHLEAHAKCDRTANETGGVKSAVDEGIYSWIKYYWYKF